MSVLRRGVPMLVAGLLLAIMITITITLTQRTTAAVAATAVGVAQVSTHKTGTCARLATTPGTDLKCWGLNYIGELGYGDMSPRGDDIDEMGEGLPVVDVGTGMSVANLSTGVASHVCAILDGMVNLKCWGDNGFGQLGYEDTTDRGKLPGQMGDALPVVDLGSSVGTIRHVATGARHTCVLFWDRRAKCFGENDEGQLGYEDTNTRGAAPSTMGDALPYVNVGTELEIEQLCVGGRTSGFTCALLNDSSTKCWGDASSGQLGSGDITNRGGSAGEMGDGLPTVDLGTGRHALTIRCGGDFVCVLLDNSDVKCWSLPSLCSDLARQILWET